MFTPGQWKGPLTPGGPFRFSAQRRHLEGQPRREERFLPMVPHLDREHPAARALQCVTSHAAERLGGFIPRGIIVWEFQTFPIADEPGAVARVEVVPRHEALMHEASAYPQ